MEAQSNSPLEYFKKGQEVEAVVLNVDVDNEKFSLGIKQIEKNPWDELSQKYTPGSVVTGKITNFTDFGIFMEIEEGIEVSSIFPNQPKTRQDFIGALCHRRHCIGRSKKYRS